MIVRFPNLRGHFHFNVEWAKVFVATLGIIAAIVLTFAVIDLRGGVDDVIDNQKIGRAERQQFQYEDRVLSCTGIRLADPQGAREEPVKGICVDVPRQGQSTTTTTPPED